MFRKGDRVLVRGAGAKEAVLRVWEVRGRGLVLCSEDGYRRLMAVEDTPRIGFPLADVVGHAEGELEARRK